MIPCRSLLESRIYTLYGRGVYACRNPETEKKQGYLVKKKRRKKRVNNVEPVQPTTEVNKNKNKIILKHRTRKH